jgi:preprotein translocase subunit SecD
LAFEGLLVLALLLENLMRRIFAIVGLVLGLMLTLAARQATQPAERFQIRLVATSASDPNGEDLTMANAPEKTLHVLKHVELDADDLESVKPGAPAEGQASIAVTLTDQGAKKSLDLTTNNVHRRVAFVFDGKVLSAPTILDPIGRSGIITLGRNAPADASTDLAKTLNEIIDARGPTTAPASK